MIIEAAGAVSFAAWLYLLMGRGGFWRMHSRAGFSLRRASARPGWPSPFTGQPVGQASWPVDRHPSVVAVIPARNEAPVVRAAIASLASQHYHGPFHIVLVDDASEDGTADAGRSAAPADMLTVLRGAPLPDGWTGKLWAVSQGIAQAETLSPDYFLLTDADIVHAPDGLEKLVAQAEQGGYDLVSWMVALHCQSLAEHALIPAFVFFFLLLYPPAWIRNPRMRTAGAAGGCLLIRRRMLERIGGITRIRGELIDDCALARAVKDAGGRVLLGVSAETHSIHEYRSFREIGAMISRTAFTQLRYSPLLLLATLVGLALTFFAPPLAAFRGNPAGLAAWTLMAVMYIPALRLYRRSLFWAPLLPLVAAFYAAATINSAWAWWRGAGGMWKGRVAPAVLPPVKPR
jgi:hopene-associated glycosyltransferase HpnB